MIINLIERAKTTLRINPANGVRDFVYPRIETEKEGQFPFSIPQYLLIDMQLGGSWVGEVDAADLPVEMEIDWVRHYQWK